jgi:hypothetical protein
MSGQWNIGDPYWCLRILMNTTFVGDVNLVLCHAGQFLVDPKTRLGDDSDHVPQVSRSVLFDLSLLRPISCSAGRTKPLTITGIKPQSKDSLELASS